MRSIFLLTTIAAIGCWIPWVALPRWRIYREQAAFEESVLLLRAGVTPAEAIKAIRWPSKSTTFTMTHDYEGKPVVVLQYEWPNVVYFVYFVVKNTPTIRDQSMEPSVSVEVFRAPGVPLDYQAKSKGGQKKATRAWPAGAAKAGYVGDWMAFLTGDRQDDLGLESEMIHADHAPSVAP